VEGTGKTEGITESFKGVTSGLLPFRKGRPLPKSGGSWRKGFYREEVPKVGKSDNEKDAERVCRS